MVDKGRAVGRKRIRIYFLMSFQNVSKIYRTEWEIRKVNGQDLMISQIDNFVGVVDISFRRRNPAYEFLFLPPFLGEVSWNYFRYNYFYKGNFILKLRLCWL